MDYLLGLITLSPHDTVPDGWAICDGQMLQINKFPALYSIIGTQYGGDGVNTFALPNLLGLELMPYMKYIIYLYGLYPNA